MMLLSCGYCTQPDCAFEHRISPKAKWFDFQIRGITLYLVEGIEEVSSFSKTV